MPDSHPHDFERGMRAMSACVAAAQACHEANRAWCAMHGDLSQPAWDAAPRWQQESAIKGVMAIHNDPATTPEQSHEGWLAVKREAGWRFGPVKDAEAKTHPCFRPYAELPPEQRAKDAIFGAVARAILDAAGVLKR